MVPTVRRNSENTVHGAHRAAHSCSDRTAYDCADRACRAIAVTRAFAGAADDALRMPGMRDRQQCQRIAATAK